MEYSLSKFDDSYIWTTPYSVYTFDTKAGTIAFGFWSFSIEKKEINYAMSKFDSVHNTVYFNSLGIIEDLGNETEDLFLS